MSSIRSGHVSADGYGKSNKCPDKTGNHFMCTFLSHLSASFRGISILLDGMLNHANKLFRLFIRQSVFLHKLHYYPLAALDIHPTGYLFRKFIIDLLFGCHFW